MLHDVKRNPDEYTAQELRIEEGLYRVETIDYERIYTFPNEILPSVYPTGLESLAINIQGIHSNWLIQNSTMLQSLQSLDLAGNQLNSTKLVTLTKILQTNLQLQKLNLIDNPLNASSFNTMVDFIKSKTLFEVGLTVERRGIDLSLLTGAIAESSTLTSITLTGKKLFEHEGFAEQICRVMNTNSNLTELKLFNHRMPREIDPGIRAENATLMLSTLKENTNLRRVEIAGFNLTPWQVPVLVDLITLNATLTHLRIPRNAISAEAHEAICSALRDNSTLQEFRTYDQGFDVDNIALEKINFARSYIERNLWNIRLRESLQNKCWKVIHHYPLDCSMIPPSVVTLMGSLTGLSLSYLPQVESAKRQRRF